MLKYENDCVDCPLPCIGSACPQKNILVHICDFCKSETAVFEIDNAQLCEDCTAQFLKEEFDTLTLKEKAELMQIKLERL